MKIKTSFTADVIIIALTFNTRADSANTLNDYGQFFSSSDYFRRPHINKSKLVTDMHEISKLNPGFVG
jgi:hypothetical protein